MQGHASQSAEIHLSKQTPTDSANNHKRIHVNISSSPCGASEQYEF